MIVKRTVKSQPERIFILLKNSEGVTTVAGDWVRWLSDGVSDLGYGFGEPEALGDSGVGYANIAGVAAQNIADGDYGLIQVWGYHDAAKVQARATIDIAQGMALQAAGNVTYVFPITATGHHAHAYPVGIAYSAYTNSAASGTIAVFIKCL